MDNKKADQQAPTDVEALAKFSEAAAKFLAEQYRTKKHSKE